MVSVLQLDKATTWKYSEPKFTPVLVADQLRDGYWLEAPDVNQDGKPDLIGYGLSLGEIYWYQNPTWARHLIVDKIKMPIGADFADVSGNGFPDLVVCYDLYGPGGRITDANPLGGKIDWIENPGNPRNTERRWDRHYIGRTIGMHRLRTGHFTQMERLEVLGLPIVAVEDVHSVLPVVLFRQPDDVLNAKEWELLSVSDDYFRMIHGVVRKEGLVPGSSLDCVLLGSDEGVTWLYYQESRRAWTKVPIGVGEIGQFEQTGFKGTGDLDVGRIGDDPFAYVAAIEPFHGNTVAVYCKDRDGAPDEVRWRRVVLDVFGDPNENGEGPGHSVVCRDFDGDGDDEFLVALRGPMPWQGVMYYKAIDARNGVFARWRVSTESAARIVVADFEGRGKLDFATIAYSVQHYYVAKEAKLMVYRNEITGSLP